VQWKPWLPALNGSPTESDYRAACTQPVHARYYRRGGSHLRQELHVVVRFDDPSKQSLGTCGITVNDPRRSLSGSVIDIGSAPLPWTT